MSSEETFWYRLGYALEKAHRGRPASGGVLAGLAERKPPRRPRATEEGFPWPAADDLVASAIALAAAHVLERWRPRRKAGLTRLLRAGAAGAAAALLSDLLLPLLRGRPGFPVASRQLSDRILTGVGQGLIYGSLLEPRVPGPALLKGAVYGSVEYAVDPVGGLANLLKAHTPQRALPVVGNLLDEVERHDRAYVEHLVFGVALALLYGPATHVRAAEGDTGDA